MKRDKNRSYRRVLTKKVLIYGHGLRTPNEAFFSLKFRTFGLGQTN